MTNEVNQDAEESVTTETTAVEQSESTSAAVETVAETPESSAPEAPAAEQTVDAPAAIEPPAPVAAAEPVAAPVATPEPAVAAPAAAIAEPESEEFDFGAILEQFEQEQTQYQQGDLVEGKVVGVTDRGVLVDFGYKSEGYVPVEEFTGPDGKLTVTVGEDVEVVIRNINSGDSAPQLSRFDALGRKVWDEIEEAFNAEAPIMIKVIDKTKGGLRVDVKGIEAFLPGSQIDSRPIRSLDGYIGQEFEAKVIKFSRRRNNIVLSRKALTDVEVNAQKAETLANIDVGYMVEGVIKNLTEYGAFVDIGGIDGLLHVTDMSWGRIHHPADQFKVNDHIQVKVLKLDREKEKVSLGFKQLQPDPWSTVVEVYPVDTQLKGIVSSVTDYGVFVELEAGVEGLVHVSELSWARRSQSPKRMFTKGQEVDVQVLGVDTVEKRISLSMKQFQENPWDAIDIRYPIGTKIRGKVRNLTDFGAFIELEEGIDGLVHVSDISWAKKIKHPKDVLKKDQEVEAIVTSIDKNGQRLSLSMKDLTPSAWEGFIATHRPGDVVKGTVSRFTNFGVFVELGEGLEGLCHISELSDDRVERAEDVATLGQEMDFKILRIEAGDQKIGLSHRAVGKDDEVTSYAADTSSGGGSGGGSSRGYSSEAKGGMASLGELANLKFGSAAEEAPVEEAPKEKKKSKKAAKAEAEEAKAEAPVAEEIPAAETEDAPSAETEEAPVEEAPAAEAPVEEVVEETPVAEEVPAEETPVAEAEATAEEVAEEAPVAEAEEAAPEADATEEPAADEAKDEASDTTTA